MENSNPILNELMEISPVVRAIDKHSPYTVPAGYFDTLAVQVILRIAAEEKSGEDPVLQISKETIYQVPEGYFGNLADSIINRIKEGDSVNAKDELERLSPLLGKIGKANPFSSPDGYFTDISDNIIAGVKAIDFVNEELENFSPVMAELKNKPVYMVPEGYFDTTPAIILQKAREQQPAKVISIGFRRKIVRYAAAAAVTGIIILTGYLYQSKNVAPATDIAAATAKIPDQEIENFLNNNTVSLTDTYADTINMATVEETGAASDDTKDLLADISDEELQKYVDQHSETPITN
jgi:hypothetical protein